MVSLKEAFYKTINSINPIKTTKNIFINESLNYVLAQDIYSKRPSPIYSNSAMDGYGFKFDNQKELKIKDTILAGDVKEINLKKNECVKIMTGAKIPSSIDTVIPFENCKLHNNSIYIEKEVKKGANIRIKGEEFNENSLLVKKGSLITPEIISILVSQGITNIKVFKKINIAILSTGNELKEPYEYANDNEIYNVNSYAIQSLLKMYNFNSDIIGIKKDNIQNLKEEIKNLKNEYEVIILSGGISYGDADFVYSALKENELKEFFRGINLKPGKPTMVGKLENSYIFALPGNPISAYTNTLFLVLPALMKLQGSNSYYHNFVYAKNITTFKFNPKKDHIALGKLEFDKWEVFQNYKYSSYMLSALINSNSYIIIEKDNPKLDVVKVIPFLNTFTNKDKLFKD